MAKYRVAALKSFRDPEVVAAREKLTAERKAQHATPDQYGGRPTKQDRRRIHRFKETLYDP